ncbi:TauD/TfdA family dioxygenase [Streptomyces sp. NPDC052701]|uniref:TauD/TfdA family dioxygenase n=1 Tax=Streptomyces sp. NPDC052701 TaxID=3155533 RepID=UPI003427471D
MKENGFSGIGRIRSLVPQPTTVEAEDPVHRSIVGDRDTRLTLFEPDGPRSDVANWAKAHVPELVAALRQTGGIMFRGFGVTTAEEFEKFASVFVDDLFNENGEHPRASVTGNVYTPVFYPPEERLLWHNENSFNRSGPTRIWFCSVKNAEVGGETPVVDSRAVFDRLDSTIRDPFLEKGVMYVRNYGTGLGLHWKDVFRTEDRDAVSERCRADDLAYEWIGDRLRTRALRPAALRADDGRMSWFNQLQHWHVSCLGEKTRTALESVFDEPDLPRNCYYGDGTRIPDEVVAEILSVYQELELALPWETGDVMMLDNIAMAHGRNPFQGERKLLVAMGGMVDYTAGKVSTP